MDCDGHPENVLTKDELLDNVMMYWVTGSAASSARMYWESFGGFAGFGRVELPKVCASGGVEDAYEVATVSAH